MKVLRQDGVWCVQGTVGGSQGARGRTGMGADREGLIK